MDIYDELGVTKVINGAATLTQFGGSLMPPEVLAAMAQAAQHFVDIDELQRKVGERIAAWTHNEAAYVSSGAAAGLALSTAACLAGLDPEKRSRLPYTDGMRNEVIVQKRGVVGYAFAIRQAGGRLVEIGTEQGATDDEMEAAITDRTVAVFYFYNPARMPGDSVPPERGVEIAHSAGVPVIVDAAAQVPPVDSLWYYHAGRPRALQRGEGAARAAEQRPDPGAQGSHRGVRVQRQPQALHWQADEGWKRGIGRAHDGSEALSGPGSRCPDADL